MESSTHSTMIDLIEEKGACRGVVYVTPEGDVDCIYAGKTVLATGGMGGIFKHFHQLQASHRRRIGYLPSP